MPRDVTNYSVYTQIQSQPEELARVLTADEPVAEAAAALGGADRVFTIGIGTAFNEALSAAWLLRAAGVQLPANASFALVVLPMLLTLAAPPLDLLSGAWKPKRRWAVDPAMLRLAKRLASALVVVSIAIPLIYALRLTADTSRADEAVVAMAKKAGVTASDASAAETEIDRRLAAAGGGPLAFSVPASALYDAMRDAPGVSLKTLSHRTDGTLTTTLAAPRVDDINQVLLALQARGYRITAQPMAGTDGQQMANITIRAVP